jgi:hypothetical protein
MQWRFSQHKALWGYNDKNTQPIQSPADCRALCLVETSFVCRSFDFIQKKKLCYLSKTSSEGKQLKDYGPSIHGVWVCGKLIVLLILLLIS